MPNAGCLDLPYVVKIATNVSRRPDILLRRWMSMRLIRSIKISITSNCLVTAGGRAPVLRGHAAGDYSPFIHQQHR
jgi:hypothetical protein